MKSKRTSIGKKKVAVKHESEAEIINRKAKNLNRTLRWGRGGTKKAKDLITEALGTKCYWCNRIITINNLAVDHKIPLNRPTEHTERQLKRLHSINNIRVICQECNFYLKGNIPEPLLQKLIDFLNAEPKLKHYVKRALYEYNSRYIGIPSWVLNS